MSTHNKPNTEETFLENIKSKYVLANTVKAHKLSSKLSKSVNSVISGTHFIGYDENELDNLNNNSCLYIKGDAEMKGTLFTSKLNVNGSSDFIGDNTINGSEHIKNNLIVDDNATFNNNILLNNSISLKKENIDNIIIIDNTISTDNYKVLLNNMLTSIQNHSQDENSVLKFYSKKSNNIYSGLLSASKKFILSTQKVIAFILVYVIYSKSKILCVKPVLDTFVLVDSEDNLIKVGNTYIKHTECIQSNDKIPPIKKIQEDELLNDLSSNDTTNINSSISNDSSDFSVKKNTIEYIKIAILNLIRMYLK